MFKNAETAAQYLIPIAEPASDSSTRELLASCAQCGTCAKHCSFLAAHGTPGQLAAAYAEDPDAARPLAFKCSLCGLCTTTCPKKLDSPLNPPAMFLQWRREAVTSGQADLSAYNGILGYEKKGCSKLFSFYSLPRNSTTVFFPGCTLAGTRPAHTLKAFEYLKTRIPDSGMVLDCCTKPSHDLGRQDFFDTMFSEMTDYLLENGITTVITACPSCHKIFTTQSPFEVKSIYQVMADDPDALKSSDPLGVTEIVIQDPCQARDDDKTLDAVRTIARQNGVEIIPSPFSGRKSLCCGEGGFTGCMNPDLSATWATKRTEAAKGRQAMTYCAGCVNSLPEESRSFHVLDLVFDRENTLAGNARVAKAPFTYVNRLKLKKKIEKQPAAVTRERNYAPDKAGRKRSSVNRFIVLSLLIAAMAGVHISGLDDDWLSYLDQDRLKALVDSLGVWAPLAYMLAYTLAPALMLPGLPLSLIGGIMFGPFWGVLYTITGATAGAGLAFLISRYVSAGFLEGRLNHPRWEKLYADVKKNGWKVVAFTRLIPLFPFNLLNYAFGLTPIRFSHYIMTTFVCMLPACIALIVFSSSIPDLLRGNLSNTFILGGGLMVLTAALPFIYRKIKTRRGLKNLL